MHELSEKPRFHFGAAAVICITNYNDLLRMVKHAMFCIKSCALKTCDLVDFKRSFVVPKVAKTITTNQLTVSTTTAQGILDPCLNYCQI